MTDSRTSGRSNPRHSMDERGPQGARRVFGSPSAHSAFIQVRQELRADDAAKAQDMAGGVAFAIQ